MYEYVDTHVSRLEPGARFFVWSARQWVNSAAKGRCVCGLLGGAFLSFRVADATDHFHIAMRTIYHNALVPLYFGSPEREQVTEHEALLLAGLASAAECGDGARPVARGLVHADMAPVLARSLNAVATEFARAGHALGTEERSTAAGLLLRARIDQVIECLPQSLRKSFTPAAKPLGRKANNV